MASAYLGLEGTSGKFLQASLWLVYDIRIYRRSSCRSASASWTLMVDLRVLLAAFLKIRCSRFLVPAGCSGRFEAQSGLKGSYLILRYWSRTWHMHQQLSHKKFGWNHFQQHQVLVWWNWSITRKTQFSEESFATASCSVSQSQSDWVCKSSQHLKFRYYASQLDWHQYRAWAELSMPTCGLLGMQISHHSIAVDGSILQNFEFVQRRTKDDIFLTAWTFWATSQN